MLDPQTHECHIAQVLGQMVKKWCHVLPEGVRALEKFNRENQNVLVECTENKRKILAAIRLKNFKCTSSGQTIDLSIYAQDFEPLNKEAYDQKQSLSKKEASNGNI